MAKKTEPNGHPKKGAQKEDKIQFSYLKSNFFRVIHADGVWGGVTPRKMIYMSFWNERPPIPKEVVHSVTEEGRLGSEIDRKTLEGIVREVEASVVMDLPTAKLFSVWLQEKIAAAEEGGREDV